MSKKFHAKDLRRDEVAEAVTHAAEGTYEFSREHRRGLLWGGIAIAVIAVAGIVIAWRTDASRRASLTAYSDAGHQWALAAGDETPKTGETKPTWDDVAAKFATVEADYARTDSGKLALLHHGLALARAGKPQDAAARLEEFTTKYPSHWATPDALAALAAAREDAGDTKGAEDALGKLRDGQWRAWPDGAAQVLLAQLYEREGRTADATAIYEAIAKDEKLKDSPFVSQAKARLDELAPSAATAASKS
jgi:hypothetical protein